MAERREKAGGTFDDLERALTRFRRLREAQMRLGLMPSREQSQRIGHLQTPARQLCEGVEAMLREMVVQPTDLAGGKRRAATRAREEA